MTATAEVPATTATADIVALLQDQTMPLTDVAALLSPQAIGKAWAAGHIEFGRQKYCTVGKLSDTPEGQAEGSILILEGGIEWTGQKTHQHKPYKDLVEPLPYCERYERADLPMIPVKDPKNDRVTYHRPQVKRDEAVTMTALQVKLTDKGLATLQV